MTYQRIYKLLPEETEYVDSGCRFAPSCLSCPFEVCRLDDPAWRQREQADAIQALRSEGLYHREVAERLGISVRSVIRLEKMATTPVSVARRKPEAPSQLKKRTFAEQ